MEVVYKTDIPNSNQYFKLFESTGWNNDYKLTREEMFASLERSYFTVSAYHSARLIGFGRLLSDGILHAMIYEMIVYPEYHGKGIGHRILRELVNKCLDNNIRDIQLFCAKGKRKFYEKFGFTVRLEGCPGMEYKR